MLKLLNHNWLTIFLTLLLLSNNSLALEILTHDSHQHLAVANAHGGHEMPSPETEIERSANVQNASYDQYQHDEKDCVCDEICCLSSVDISAYLRNNQSILEGSHKSVLPCHYRSIILNLSLPPPTR